MSQSGLAFRSTQQYIPRPVTAPCGSDRFPLIGGQSDHQRGRSALVFGKRGAACPRVHDTTITQHEKSLPGELMRSTISGMKPFMVLRDGTLLDRTSQQVIGKVWMAADGWFSESPAYRHGPFAAKKRAARAAWEKWRNG